MAAHSRVYDYLFSGFVKQAWYWEIWNAIRKSLIMACSVFFQSWGLPMQLWASLGLLAFFLGLFAQVKPYNDRILNRLEVYALTADFLTLFMGMGLYTNINAGEMKSDTFAQILSVSVIAVNMLFIGYTIYILWKHSEWLQKTKSLVWNKEEQSWVINPLRVAKLENFQLKLQKVRSSLSV